MTVTPPRSTGGPNTVSARALSASRWARRSMNGSPLFGSVPYPVSVAMCRPPLAASPQHRGPTGPLAPTVPSVAPGHEALHAPAVVGGAHTDDDVRRARSHVLVGAGDLLGRDAHRALDRRWVAPHLAAPLIEHAVLALEVVGRPAPVPQIRVLGGEAQRYPLALAADQEGDGPSHGLRIVACPALLDDGERGGELPQAVGRGAELVAVLAVVALEPAGADAQDEPPAGDVIHGLGHVREQGRVAVAVAGHQAAHGRTRGHLGHRSEKRPALEVWAIGIAVQREEVVPVPDRVNTQVFHPEHRVAELAVSRVLGVKLHANADRHRCLPGLLRPQAEHGHEGFLRDLDTAQ